MYQIRGRVSRPFQWVVGGSGMCLVGPGGRTLMVSRPSPRLLRFGWAGLASRKDPIRGALVSKSAGTSSLSWRGGDSYSPFFQPVPCWNSLAAAFPAVRSPQQPAAPYVQRSRAEVAGLKSGSCGGSIIILCSCSGSKRFLSFKVAADCSDRD